MRDPAGHITFEDAHVLRTLKKPAGDAHFLKSELAAKWVKTGDLIAYEWLDECTLRSPLIPFVTHPSEWSNEQFFAAAKLTLKLQIEAVQAGFELKDASAWNVVFCGLRPVFVDLLSFEQLEQKAWRAAGQFARHFLLPLVLAKHQKLEARYCLHLWRDGVPPTAAKQMLGLWRFATRFWPLMANANEVEFKAPDSWQYRGNAALKGIKQFRKRLDAGIQWMLDGADPSNSKNTTIWGNYLKNRDHYDSAELADKRNLVHQWLHTIQPTWVLDVGCNSGEFSELAVSVGANVICWDADPEAMGTLCTNHMGNTHWYPILGPVDDPAAGRGWMGNEFPSIMLRIKKNVDVVMLLAILHHLSIANGLRLQDVFAFAKSVARRYVIVEMISEADRRLLELCQKYNRHPAEFTLSQQYDAAASAGLRIENRSISKTGMREIALFAVA